ncbi:hypothetical protein DV048_08675, partial [Neisseria gonorrhoeae]
NRFPVFIFNFRGNYEHTHQLYATVGKRVSQCYVTSVISTIGVTTSDAICSGGGTNKAKSQCNALLKAAGRC